MDALYILGKGSKFNNEELRYSLRTLERYIPTINRVIVVGENPKFLSDKVELYERPEAVGNKEFCIAKKIEYACKMDIVTGDFLFLNDDFFFTKPITPETYPFYCKGSLNISAPNRMYQQSLKNTADYLRKNGFSYLHFDVHTPIIYNAENFLKLAHVWDESKKLNAGFVVKSIYANIYKKSPTLYKDCKISRLKTPTDFKRIQETNCFSVSDVGFIKGAYEHLKKEFPKPSKYEV